MTELVGSALLPLFLQLARRRVRRFLALVAILAVASIPLAGAPHRLDVFMYMVDFAAGAMLRSLPLARVVPHRIGVVVALLGFALGCFARPLWFLITRDALQPLEYDYGNPFVALLEGAGSAVVIAGVLITSPAIGLLRRRSAVFLGDVSYSVYLLHFPLMFCIAHVLTRIPALRPAAAPVPLVALTVAIVLPLATACHRWIELPGISAGRRVAKSYSFLWLPERDAGRRADADPARR